MSLEAQPTTTTEEEEKFPGVLAVCGEAGNVKREDMITVGSSTRCNKRPTVLLWFDKGLKLQESFQPIGPSINAFDVL